MQTAHEDAKEQNRKLVDHYYRLGNHVFTTWQNAQTTISSRTLAVAGYKSAFTPLYLHSHELLGPLQPNGHLYLLAMEHIKTGYPELQALFDELRIHEDRNNQKASALVETIEREVDDDLKTLANLSALQPVRLGHNYDRSQILRAIHETTQLTLVGIASISSTRDFLKIMNPVMETEGSSKLVDETMGEIANGGDSAIRSLKNEIERLRALHKSDFDALKANVEQDSKIVQVIRDKVSDIISEIEDLQQLKGECAFEKQFSR